jgi:hypothetical protein
MEAERQQRGALPVGEEAEVADAYEAAWQQVEQEAAQELVDRQSEEPLLVGVRGISPAEGDVALLKGDQSAVGDGDAVGLAAEIAQRVFRAAEGWLGIDDPVVAEQGSEPCGEGPWFRQCCEVTVERELVLVEGGLQSGDELAAKDPAEHLHRQEETVARRDPTGVVGSEAASGGHAVDMGMKLEPLVPGMEHAEEADLSAQVAGIASDLQQGSGAGLNEQAVDHALVLECERSEFTRQREDEVHVAGGQLFLFACLEPAHTSVRLASGAMPVATRVIGDGRGVAAGGTAVAMAAESGGGQRVIASSTFWCCQVIQRWLRSMKLCPALRTISAISSGGRSGWGTGISSSATQPKSTQHPPLQPHANASAA